MENRNVRITQGTERNMPQCQPGALRRNSFKLLLLPHKKTLTSKNSVPASMAFQIVVNTARSG